MSGLLSISPQSRVVVVQGSPVTIYGVSVGAIAALMGRFPAIAAMFTGQNINVAALLPLGNEIVAAIIAAGCGESGDAQAEEIASHLALGDQVELLSAIIEVTMPGGVGPLMQRLNGLADTLQLKGATSQPVAAAALPTTLLSPLNGSSPGAMPPPMSGDTPLAASPVS